jgi:hypothetical protein
VDSNIEQMFCARVSLKITRKGEGKNGCSIDAESGEEYDYFRFCEVKEVERASTCKWFIVYLGSTRVDEPKA